MNSTETKTGIFEQWQQREINTLRTRLEAVEKANRELVEALIQTFGEYLQENYSDVPDGRALGEFSVSDLHKAKAALSTAEALKGEG